MRTMRMLRAIVALGFVLLLAAPALAQASSEEDLEKRVRDLERQVQELKQLLEKREKPAPQEAATKEQLSNVEKAVEALKPGLENFVLTGFTFAEFREPEGDERSTFNVGFNPIFLWALNDRLIFEGELEIGLMDGETEVGLDYAQIAYFLHDYVTVGVGKFLLPFNIWPERLHPAWINKLPTAPLPFQEEGGIAPMTDLGVQVRGGVPLFGDTKMNYAVYVTNGPRLLTTGDNAGELRFDNTTDINGNKAVGGRIGILPIPELEAGFSYQLAEVGTGAFDGIDAHLLGADFSYVRESDLIGGHVDLRFEYVRQQIDDATYTVGGTPFTFENNKWGWYTQIAYRPTLLEIPIVPDLEAVFRYSKMDWPSRTPLAANEPGEGVDRQQFSFGLNYWITPSVPLKIAYNINDNLKGPVEGDNLFVIQVAYGF